MRIVAFSDYRVQNLKRTVEFVATMSPDVILYAGDDTNRFGPLNDDVRAKLLSLNSGQDCIHRCQSPYHYSWYVAPDGEIRRQVVCSKLGDTYYFNLRIPGHVVEADIIAEVAHMLNQDRNGFQRAELQNMQRLTNREGAPAESLLKDASVHFRSAQGDRVEGTISLRTRDYVRDLVSASRCGFGAVLGNDDDPVYKALLDRDGAFDLHERQMSVGGFTIMGQEGTSLSDGRGLGRIVYSEDEIERHIDSPCSKSDSRVILVSHTPPYRILDRSQRFVQDHIGSPAVREFINNRKPLLVLCGHVHSQGGCEARVGPTTIINLASHDSEGSPGRVCAVDISDNLDITTKWFLVLPDRILEYSARRLAEGEAINSVLNIRGIGYKKANELELNDIRTVRDVSAVGVDGLVRCGIGKVTAQKIAKRAESLLDRKAKQLAPLLIPNEPLMFVDIETNLAQSYIWLISVLVEGRRDSLRQFYAKTPADEKGILREFLSYCGEFDGVLCYYARTGFDERLIQRQVVAHGMDDVKIPRWFDLCLAIEKSIILPLGSLSLKEVADHFGYAYKHPDMDGFGAAWEYERSMGHRDESTTRMLLGYAEDDVRSLEHIICNMCKVTGVAPDRSWIPPEHALPASFGEQCTLLRSFRKRGLVVAEMARMFGKSVPYIYSRLNADPETVKGRKVTFNRMHASDVGVSLYRSGRPSGASRVHGRIRGEVVEQISENVFMVRTKDSIFQISGKFLQWEQ